MSERIEISAGDVKESQIAFWLLGGLAMSFMTLYLVFNFTFVCVIIWLGWFIFCSYLQYVNKNVWNVWCIEGELYFENIYKLKVADITLFRSIEMTSPSGTYYSLYLNNGESYSFTLSTAENFKVLFKFDNQFYAKRMTKKLAELKVRHSKES